MLWPIPADLRRERIGMMFISIDASTGAARSVAAASTTRAACRRLVRGRQMNGGKCGNCGNSGNPLAHLSDDVLRSAPARSRMAERVGFEPTVRLHAQRFSRPSRSTTLAPLRGPAYRGAIPPRQPGPNFPLSPESGVSGVDSEGFLRIF